nr:diaminopimelate decarboxylase [Pigmentibacter ruber]
MRPFISLKSIEERINGEGLEIDAVPLAQILALDKTPVYVTSLNAVSQRLNKYKEALSCHFIHNEIFYAMKANFATPILKTVVKEDFGIDIVSIGEWRKAIASGIHPKKICFAGVGKKETEWKEALLGGLGNLSVEHLTELSDILDFLYKEKNLNSFEKKVLVSLRLNPAVEVETHPHLKTGALNSKFGILYEHFQTWLKAKKLQFTSEDLFLKWINPLKGIHVHIGSQLTENSIFPLVVKKVLDCAHFMYENKIFVQHIDFGGGLGVGQNGVPENGEDIFKHVHFVCNAFKEESKKYPKLLSVWNEDYSNLSVCMEPGRSVVASSTIFLTKVLYEKRNSVENIFCYVDGAMNDFPRPSLYGAIHHAELVNYNIKKLQQEDFNHFSWNVVGPVCESGDFLAKNAILPQIHKGDIIAFFEAGAYCRSMASQYNLRELPSEIFVRDGLITDII